MELPQVSIYFKFSSEMFSRTSSQICGRWYLPMFLFRDGLLTLIYRASLMVLLRFWSSLPSMEKLSIVTAWPEMLEWSYIGEGALRCSLNLPAKVSKLGTQQSQVEEPNTSPEEKQGKHQQSRSKQQQNSNTLHCCTCDNILLLFMLILVLEWFNYN